MPNAAVRANARPLPEAIDPYSIGDDRVFLSLRTEIERLRAQRQPLEETANALYPAFENTIREDGFDAARAWSEKVGMDSKLEEIDEIDKCAGRIVERMLALGPKTPASIAAVAAALKDEALGHLWEKPEGDRDWDVLLLSRFLDGLIALLPRTVKEDEHLPRVASAA